MISRITKIMIKNGIINQSDEEIYEYGIKEGLILLGNQITSLSIGLLMQMFWESLIFMISYLVLRSYAGGIHAKTHLKCYLISIAISISTLLIIKYLMDYLMIISIIMFFGSVIVFLLSPVEDKNKKLSKLEIVVYRKKARIILFVEILLFVCAVVLGINMVYTTISVSVFTLAIVLILGVIKNRLQ